MGICKKRSVQIAEL